MQRLDMILKKRFPDFSRAVLQRLVKDGHVRVSGRSVKKPHTLVDEEKLVECNFPAAKKLEWPLAQTGALSIIFEDKNIIVIDKSAGISVHPSSTDKKTSLVSFLLAHCKDLSGIGGVLRPGIVHRLDRDTSGVLVVA